MIRRRLRSLVRRAGWDLTRWPSKPSGGPPPGPGYSLEAVLRQVLADHGVTHLVDVGAKDGGWGRSVRALGYTGSLVSFAPVVSPELSAAAAADARWDLHPIALGAAPGVLRIGATRVQVARLDDRLDTVVPRASVVMLRLDTGADLAVLKGAEKVLARISVVQTRGTADDERTSWLLGRGLSLAGMFPAYEGRWDTIVVRPSA